MDNREDHEKLKNVDDSTKPVKHARKEWVHEGKTMLVENLMNKNIYETLAPATFKVADDEAEEESKSTDSNSQKNTVVISSTNNSDSDSSCSKTIVLSTSESTVTLTGQTLQNNDVNNNNNTDNTDNNKNNTDNTNSNSNSKNNTDNTNSNNNNDSTIREPDNLPTPGTNNSIPTSPGETYVISKSAKLPSKEIVQPTTTTEEDQVVSSSRYKIKRVLFPGSSFPLFWTPVFLLNSFALTLLPNPFDPNLLRSSLLSPVLRVF